MFELPILVVIIVAIVLIMRGGKPANPVVIEQPGQYHITLAPQLTHAQLFIENIAREFSSLHTLQGDIPNRYYEASDAKLAAGPYLLAAAGRNGVLYFQAIKPQPLPQATPDNFQAIRSFAEAVLVNLPLTGHVDAAGAATLQQAIDTVAIRAGIMLTSLDKKDHE